MNYPDVLLRLESLPPPPGAIEKMYGLMLYGALKTISPINVLELGTAQGFSTAFMMLALNENEKGHLWTCDIVPADNPVWRQLGMPEDRLTYLSNDTAESIKDKLPSSLDFIFHDAGHSWDEVKQDLSWLLPRLTVGGSLVVHDVSYSKVMGEQLLEFFDSNPDEFKYERIEEGCGVGIATRIKKTEVPQSCKDVSNGSMMQKDMDSLPEKMAKTTLLTTPKFKVKKDIKNFRKIKMSSSKVSKKSKVQEPKKLVLSK